MRFFYRAASNDLKMRLAGYISLKTTDIGADIVFETPRRETEHLGIHAACHPHLLHDGLGGVFSAAGKYPDQRVLLEMRIGGAVNCSH